MRYHPELATRWILCINRWIANHKIFPVCVYVCMCVWVYVRMFAYVRMCVCVYVYVYAYVYVHACTCVRMDVRTYMLCIYLHVLHIRA